MDLSIVVTTFNYERYLEDCLASCICQDVCGLEYEIIVVDDGSTDNTTKILCQSFPPNVRVYKIENSGIEKASNYGFLKSKGDYIVRVDADDILLPAYVATMEEHLTEEHGFFYSNYQVINHNGNLIRETNLPAFESKEVQDRGDFLATGTLVKSELIKRLNGYRTDIVNSGLENYEFILKLIQMGVVGLHVPKILFGYRRHGGNISDLKKDQIIQNGKDLFVRNGLGGFETNEYHPYELKI
jgi:glycosyltransferase involved in cell wall biosynthesis